MGKFQGGEPSMASTVMGKFGVSAGNTTGGMNRGPKVRATGSAAPSKSSAKVGNKGGGKMASGGLGGSKGIGAGGYGSNSGTGSAGGPIGGRFMGAK